MADIIAFILEKINLTKATEEIWPATS